MNHATHVLSRRVSKWSLGLLACAFVLLLSACGKGDADDAEVAEEGALYEMGAPITDSTYALIVRSDFGSDTLTTAQFRAQFQQVVQQVPALGMNQDQSRRLRRDIAEAFIRRHLLFGEANRLGLQGDTAEVSERIRTIRSRFPSAEAFENALMQQGLTMDSLRNSLGEEMKLEQLQQRMVENAPEPSPEEVEKFRQDQAEEVRVQHILFAVNTPEQKQREAAIRDTAQAVLDSVKAGADFGELARRYSDDPGSAQRGGDLSFFSRGTMVPAFEDAAFALQDSGDVAPDLVHTNYGYHIIRLTGRRTGQVMDSTNAQAMLMQQRRAEEFEKSYTDLANQAVVRVNPDVVEADLNEREGR